MKSIQIVIHCLPREIDQLERVCNSLRESHYFAPNIEMVLDVSLNLHDCFTNWENSKIPKEFFEHKFNNIKQLHSDWAVTLFTVEKVDSIQTLYGDKCLGINDKRRNSINDGLDYDYIMYLDLDVFFPVTTFMDLSKMLHVFEQKYKIFSAETVKLWDSSWDGLVNKEYINEDNEYFKTVDPYKVNRIAFDNISEEQIGFRTVSPIKFGGGWINIFSKELLKFINIPESLGSYGLDDTFVMLAAGIMQQKGYDIVQYALNGTVCIENYSRSLYKFNPYEGFIDDISLINKGKEFKHTQKAKAEENFSIELIKFKDKI